jgi:hypothetical protein
MVSMAMAHSSVGGKIPRSVLSHFMLQTRRL